MIQRTGHPRTAALRAATLLAGALLLVGGVIGAAGPAHAAAADDILAMVNAARAENGVGPVRLNGAMTSVATAWSQRMADAGAMSHNPDYSAQIPGGWTRAAENVAFDAPPDAAGLQAAWMGSPGHRANILDPAFTDIGIGVVVQGGSAWGTQVFGAYGPPLPLEQPPVAAPAQAPEPAPAAPPSVDPEPAPVAATPTPSPQPTAPAPTPSASPSVATGAPTDLQRASPGDRRAGADDVPAVAQGPGAGLSSAWWLVPLVGLVVLSGAGLVARRRRRRSTATSGGVGGASGGAGSGHGEP